MAYTEIPDADVAIDAYGREDRVYKRLRDNIRAMREAVFTVFFAEASTAGVGSYEVLHTFSLEIPNVTGYTGITRELRVKLDGKTTANSVDLRLRDNASGTAGAAVNVTSTSYVEAELVLTVDAAWVGTARSIEVQARQNTSGTGSAKSVDRVTAKLAY